jgi:hypothetical protein
MLSPSVGERLHEFVYLLFFCVGVLVCMGVIWCQWFGKEAIFPLSFKGGEGSIGSSYR